MTSPLEPVRATAQPTWSPGVTARPDSPHSRSPSDTSTPAPDSAPKTDQFVSANHIILALLRTCQTATRETMEQRAELGSPDGVSTVPPSDKPVNPASDRIDLYT